MNITIDHLNMTYPTGKQALRDINLQMETPSLIGLLGPNGAGKSTLMKLLVAALLPTTGSISVDGTPLAACEKHLKSSLGYLPQHFGLYDELSVWQFLDYMAALKGIQNSKSAIDQAIIATDLAEKRKAKIRTLSGGQRQRVGIAQALLGTPEFLIFDEPTVGLDPEERIRFRNFFSETAQDKLVLLSTHIIEDVQSVCNQLIVIDQGRILFTGTPEALIRQAEGHVGMFLEQPGGSENSSLHITSRVNTAQGVLCRGVSEILPGGAQAVEPTLEDAYLFLITREGGAQ